MRSTIAGICLALPLVVGLASPSLGDDREDANREMVRAVMAWNEAQVLTEDDSLVIKRKITHLEHVVESLETIVEKHSGSDLAVRLITGEKIGPLSLEGARKELEDALKSAEQRCDFWEDSSCLFAQALDAAEDVPVALSPLAYASVARSLAEAGRIEEADQLLAEIHPDDIDTGQRMTHARAKKDAEGILAIVEKEKMNEGSTWGYRAVQGAIALAQIGAYDQAWTLASSLQSEENRNEAQAEVIFTMHLQGDAGRAAEALASIESKSGRDLARRGIIGAHIEAGQLEEARRMAKAIEDAAWRDVTLIGLMHPELEDKEFGRAIADVEAEASTNRADRDELRAALPAAKAMAHARSHDLERAIELALEDPSQGSRNATLRKLAMQRAEERRVEEALEIANLIDDRKQADLARGRIAVITGRLRTASKALEVAETITDPEMKALAICSAASAAAEAGDSTGAPEILKLVDPAELCRSMALGEIAVHASRSEVEAAPE